MSEVLRGRWSYASISDKIADEVLARRPGWLWRAGFWGSFFGMVVFAAAIVHLLRTGVGIWGVDIPVAWGFATMFFK